MSYRINKLKECLEQVITAKGPVHTQEFAIHLSQAMTDIDERLRALEEREYERRKREQT